MQAGACILLKEVSKFLSFVKYIIVREILSEWKFYFRGYNSSNLVSNLSFGDFCR